MTFRTIDTDIASVGATTETDSMAGVTRRSRFARRSAIRGSRISSRVWVYSSI